MKNERLPDLLKRLGEKRALANAIYSIYKDLRDSEVALTSQVEEIFRDEGLSENEIIAYVHTFRGGLDKLSKDKHNGRS